MGFPHLPTTMAVVEAIRGIARDYGVAMTVTDDIGADQTSRRITVGALGAQDPDGSLPHEAYVELSGSPVVTVQIFPEDDATIVVEDVEFSDIPRDDVPAFLRSIYGGLAYVEGKPFPPSLRLVVPLPGDETYAEPVLRMVLTPWLIRSARK
jgi:hypothetical protein